VGVEVDERHPLASIDVGGDAADPDGAIAAEDERALAGLRRGRPRSGRQR
jgi:hypothetical protein